MKLHAVACTLFVILLETTPSRVDGAGQQPQPRQAAAGTHTVSFSPRRWLAGEAPSGDGSEQGAETGANAALPAGPLPAQVASLSPTQQPEPGAALPQRCVFVLGTGRSGSTSLMDAVNQLPGYLIRGEQDGAFWYLYLAWRMLESAWAHAFEFQAVAAHLEAKRGPAAAAHLNFTAVKAIYEAHATQRKLPWFNDLHPQRLREAVRGFYAATYGYHGPGYVSGFKDIRFVRGRAFAAPQSSYDDFADFVRFLRILCDDVKVLLNSRASAGADDNAKLEHMLERSGLLDKKGEEQFAQDLQVTHEWYDRYALEHSDHAFRVVMEDMFNKEVNATLAQRLLRFLWADPTSRIDFARMPTWSGPKTATAAAPRPTQPLPSPTPWHLRRRLAGWLRGVADFLHDGAR